MGIANADPQCAVLRCHQQLPFLFPVAKNDNENSRSSDDAGNSSFVVTMSHGHGKHYSKNETSPPPLITVSSPAMTTTACTVTSPSPPNGRVEEMSSNVSGQRFGIETLVTGFLRSCPQTLLYPKKLSSKILGVTTEKMIATSSIDLSHPRLHTPSTELEQRDLIPEASCAAAAAVSSELSLSPQSRTLSLIGRPSSSTVSSVTSTPSTTEPVSSDPFPGLQWIDACPWNAERMTQRDNSEKQTSKSLEAFDKFAADGDDQGVPLHEDIFDSDHTTSKKDEKRRRRDFDMKGNDVLKFGAPWAPTNPLFTKAYSFEGREVADALLPAILDETKLDLLMAVGASDRFVSSCRLSEDGGAESFLSLTTALAASTARIVEHPWTPCSQVMQASSSNSDSALLWNRLTEFSAGVDVLRSIVAEGDSSTLSSSICKGTTTRLASKPQPDRPFRTASIASTIASTQEHYPSSTLSISPSVSVNFLTSDKGSQELSSDGRMNGCTFSHPCLRKTSTFTLLPQPESKITRPRTVSAPTDNEKSVPDKRVSIRTLRRRLERRACKRGSLELDSLMRAFATHCMSMMSYLELLDFEKLLMIDNLTIFSMLSGQRGISSDLDSNSALPKILSFVNSRHPNLRKENLAADNVESEEQ